MPSEDKTPQTTKPSALTYAQAWGLSPFPPTLLATFITALHFRPFRTLPMVFPPVLLFSTYLNLSSFKIDAAGLTAAWSGLYLLLASRRRVTGSFGARMGKQFGARGWVRGAAMGVAGGNVLACGGVYALGKREGEESP